MEPSGPLIRPPANYAGSTAGAASSGFRDSPLSVSGGPGNVTPSLVSYPQQAAVTVDERSNPYPTTGHPRGHHQYFHHNTPPVCNAL